MRRTKGFLEGLAARSCVGLVAGLMAACSGDDPTNVGTNPLPNVPVVTTTSLPAGRVNDAYAAAMTATGGTPPYTWFVDGALPPGLRLSSSGAITGTPTYPAGTYRFEVRVLPSGTDARQASAALQLTTTAPNGLEVTTTALPMGRAEASYAATLEARSGVMPYSWILVGSPNLFGLSLSPDGRFDGTPSVPYTQPIRVQVQDFVGATAIADLTLTIAPAPFAILTTTLPHARLGSRYDTPIETTGGDQSGVPLFDVIEGSLPPGLAIERLRFEKGFVVGEPTTVGTFAFTLRATSGDGQTATQQLTLRVTGPLLAIATTALPDTEVGALYEVALVVAGGVAPYTWSRTSGSLPPGLTLASDGLVAGAAATTGMFGFRVQVQSGDGQTATADLSITVNP